MTASHLSRRAVCVALLATVGVLVSGFRLSESATGVTLGSKDTQRRLHDGRAVAPRFRALQACLSQLGGWEVVCHSGRD